jgi:hypothetical protein
VPHWSFRPTFCGLWKTLKITEGSVCSLWISSFFLKSREKRTGSGNGRERGSSSLLKLGSAVAAPVPLGWRLRLHDE